MKRTGVLALLLVLPFASSRASAAPTKKQQQQCIAGAESGQQLRSSGKLREARKALAACTASVCPAVIRRDCGRWIEEIDAATPSVSVKLEDETGADVPDGRVFLDGEPLSQAGDGHATPIDPGVHRFVWARDGGNVEQELVVREGERNRVVVLRVAGGAVTAPPPPPPADTSSRSPAPWIVGGVGLALAAGGGIFWGIGLNDRANLSASCAASHTCVETDVDASRTKLIIGDVLLGVGIATVITGVILLLGQGGPSSPTTAAVR